MHQKLDLVVNSFTLKVARIRGVGSSSNKSSRVPERFYVVFSALEIYESLLQFFLKIWRYWFFGKLS